MDQKICIPPVHGDILDKIGFNLAEKAMKIAENQLTRQISNLDRQKEKERKRYYRNKHDILRGLDTRTRRSSRKRFNGREKRQDNIEILEKIHELPEEESGNPENSIVEESTEEIDVESTEESAKPYSVINLPSIFSRPHLVSRRLDVLENNLKLMNINAKNNLQKDIDFDKTSVCKLPDTSMYRISNISTQTSPSMIPNVVSKTVKDCANQDVPLKKPKVHRKNKTKPLPDKSDVRNQMKDTIQKHSAKIQRKVNIFLQNNMTANR
ncbi:uncharacterized protein LOC141909145 isoform X1 [Tubulanus polymorphus]|uniref:uncharacterized protein LOC141909145 isoform X1 n=1 Tax=Tubulanus polymorphus TaxID=672921 RepID=UPI003DA5D119